MRTCSTDWIGEPQGQAMGVSGVEPLCVLLGEGVACDEAVKCRVSESGELNFGACFAISGICVGLGVKRCGMWDDASRPAAPGVPFGRRVMYVGPGASVL